MKKILPDVRKCNFRFFLIAGVFSVLFIALSSESRAQIYEPEGLNMPGVWNSWTNPPANNLALASSTQVPGGRIIKNAVGTTRWQTIFSVAATGADLLPGTYEWLFTSGSSSNYYQNKWSNVTVVMNTLQNYTKEGPTNNSITLVDGKWYTMNWEDKGYQDSRAIFMETSAAPVAVTGFNSPPGTTYPANTAYNLTIYYGGAGSAEEIQYVRYTTDSWATSVALPVVVNAGVGTVQIPGQPSGTVVSYYFFSSTVGGLTADFDLYSIKIENNSGANYTYTVDPPPPAITWANLQFPASGAIETGALFEVYGQALIPGITGQATQAAGLQAWVGYSTENTDPATWSNWISASYNTAVGNNDEFIGNLGAAISSAGTYYYATRFQLNTGAYVYGGYNGGFWDGITNVSGTLTVSDPIPDPDFDWVNLQFPGSGAIEVLQDYEVFAQAFIDGTTGQPTAAPGVQAWIGYSTTNSNPDTWTNWILADYNNPAGNNDEFKANLGLALSTPGTYYYASRFQLNTGDYYYGGYSESGGGIWDGATNISGVVEVAEAGSGIDWVNLQFPGSDTIVASEAFTVYAQAYISGVTGSGSQTPQLECWIGYNSSNTDPSEWTNWVPAAFNTAAGNNDEFLSDIGPEFTTPGVWYYASRFKFEDGTYEYGGYSTSGGGIWDGTNNVSGVLTVTEAPATFPVLFTIIDGTLNNTNIKFKGEMTAWDTVAMTRNGNEWTLTLDVPAGTYQWGAIEDDGSASGIWLIEGDNLVVTIDETGVVTGTVTYTTLITDISVSQANIRIYPNPTAGKLYLTLPVQSTVKLCNMSGKVLINKEEAVGETLIDLDYLPAAEYILQVFTAKEKIIQKIVKQ